MALNRCRLTDAASLYDNAVRTQEIAQENAAAERPGHWAFVGCPNEGVEPDLAIRLGVAWTRRRASPRCVLVPAMADYQDNATLKRLVPERDVRTTRSRSASGSGGYVLACWLGTADLSRLYDSHTGPICLLLWRGTVFERAWINARGAIDLVTGDVGYANDRVAIGPVVAEALHSISKTINHSSPFTHPTDRSKVVTAL